MITTDQARFMIRDAMAEVGFFKPDLVTYGDPDGPFSIHAGRVLISHYVTDEDELSAFYKAWVLVAQLVGEEAPSCCDCFLAKQHCPHVEAFA